MGVGEKAVTHRSLQSRLAGEGRSWGSAHRLTRQANTKGPVGAKKGEALSNSSHLLTFGEWV